jgi:hypothetical protein
MKRRSPAKRADPKTWAAVIALTIASGAILVAAIVWAFH